MNSATATTNATNIALRTRRTASHSIRCVGAPGTKRREQLCTGGVPHSPDAFSIGAGEARRYCDPPAEGTFPYGSFGLHDSRIKSRNGASPGQGASRRAVATDQRTHCARDRLDSNVTKRHNAPVSDEAAYLRSEVERLVAAALKSDGDHQAEIAWLEDHHEAELDRIEELNEQDSAHLREAMAKRDLIGQAKGVLMATLGCSADEAVGLLVKQSQAENRKLYDLAAEVTARTRRSNA